MNVADTLACPARRARDLRDLLERTVAGADRLAAPVLERLGGAEPDPGLTPQERFALFLDASDCLSERESGARLFFGFLCHAYALHGRTGALSDGELLEAGERAVRSLLDTPDGDVPEWLAEEPAEEPEAAGWPPAAGCGGEGPAVPLGRAFGEALAFAQGWCETRLLLEDADGPAGEAPPAGEPDLRWWTRVLRVPDCPV